MPTARAAAAADDSDSDDVEFVGECDFIDTLPQRARPQANATVPAPKPSAIQINRNKYAAKKSMDALEERSNSPKTNIAPPPLTTTSSAPIVTKAGGVVNIDAADAKRGGAMETSDGKAEDLDVDKIMSALKELQVSEVFVLYFYNKFFLNCFYIKPQAEIIDSCFKVRSRLHLTVYYFAWNFVRYIFV